MRGFSGKSRRRLSPRGKEMASEIGERSSKRIKEMQLQPRRLRRTASHWDNPGCSGSVLSAQSARVESCSHVEQVA
eukprot:2610251-Karenia_brevis.AAC.1